MVAAVVTPSDMVTPNTAQADAQATKSQAKKTRMFRATIAVCVLYGGLALAILVACLFTDGGKALLIEQAGAFTVTLVTGMCLVILFLGVSVYKYEPKPDDLLRTDPYACPDYFDLHRVPDADVKTLPEAHRHQMQYVCKPRDATSGNPSGIFDGTSDKWTFAAMSTDPTTANQPLAKVGELNAATPAALRMQCHTVYPQVLQNLDYKDNPDNPTKYRCALVKACTGVSWSGVCPA